MTTNTGGIATAFTGFLGRVCLPSYCAHMKAAALLCSLILLEEVRQQLQCLFSSLLEQMNRSQTARNEYSRKMKGKGVGESLETEKE